MPRTRMSPALWRPHCRSCSRGRSASSPAPSSLWTKPAASWGSCRACRWARRRRRWFENGAGGSFARDSGGSALSGAVGIDIGGTAVKLAAVSAAGEPGELVTLPTRPSDGPEETLRRVAEAAAPLLPAARLGERRILGVACAGAVRADAGLVTTSPNLPGWKDVPVVRLLAPHIDAEIRLLNDADAFLLGEARCGAGRGARVLLGLTLGTGVGGAILLDGRLFTGARYGAGEFGHTPLEWNGPVCPCGSRGCLEVFAGNRAIVKKYMELSGEALSPQVLRRLPRDRDALTPEIISRAADDGDGLARETYRQAGEALGASLAGFANIFDPDRIVIGGGVALAGEWLLAPARKALRERMLDPGRGAPDVRSAELGTAAAVVGAALDALGFAGDGGPAPGG
ncbi:MAG: ROK family protein [Candidatus Eisenbacteria bacterium]|nr:ROK family protein [Candidatus Eisenbacteria bacterium]